MPNHHTKKKELAEASAASDLQAQLEKLAADRVKAEAEDKSIHTLVRVRIYRMDNTVDEIVQTIPRMKKGETITFSATPEND